MHDYNSFSISRDYIELLNVEGGLITVPNGNVRTSLLSLLTLHNFSFESIEISGFRRQENTPDNIFLDAVAIDTIGIKASFVAPASGLFNIGATFVQTNAGVNPDIRIQIQRGAEIYDLQRYGVVAQAQYLGQVALRAGDIIQWNVTTAGGLGTVGDFTFSAEIPLVQTIDITWHLQANGIDYYPFLNRRINAFLDVQKIYINTNFTPSTRIELFASQNTIAGGISLIARFIGKYYKYQGPQFPPTMFNEAKI